VFLALMDGLRGKSAHFANNFVGLGEVFPAFEDTFVLIVLQASITLAD